MDDEMKRPRLKILRLSTPDEEVSEERNDVYIYKTLRYPPTSTPPTAD